MSTNTIEFKPTRRNSQRVAPCGTAEQRLIHHLPFRLHENVVSCKRCSENTFSAIPPQVTTLLTAAVAAAGNRVSVLKRAADHTTKASTGGRERGKDLRCEAVYTLTVHTNYFILAMSICMFWLLLHAISLG